LVVEPGTGDAATDVFLAFELTPTRAPGTPKLNPMPDFEKFSLNSSKLLERRE
jgi:hypothetical protein